MRPALKRKTGQPPANGTSRPKGGETSPRFARHNMHYASLPLRAVYPAFKRGSLRPLRHIRQPCALPKRKAIKEKSSTAIFKGI